MEASPMLLIKSMMVTIAIDKWGDSSTNTRSMRSLSMCVLALYKLCTRFGFAFTLSTQSQTCVFNVRMQSVHHIAPYKPTHKQMATITDKRMRIPRLSCAQCSLYMYTVFIFFRTFRIYTFLSIRCCATFVYASLRLCTCECTV